MIDSPMIEHHRSDPTLQDLLKAFVRLQGHNHRLTGRLVSHHGVSESHLRALLVLARSGDLTTGQLGRLTASTTSSTTFLVDKLEHAGHARRRPHPTDRRSTILSLTDAGRAIADDTWARYEDMFIKAVPTDDRELLARRLDDLTGAVSLELAP